MNPLATLALVGVAEGIVYLLRYRSAHHRSAVWSASTTAGITALRVLFIVAGVDAAMADTSLAWLLLSYTGSSTLTTGLLHEYLERRKARLHPTERHGTP